MACACEPSSRSPPSPHPYEGPKEIEHVYAHDVESWYYILLFVLLGYYESGVPKCDPLGFRRRSDWREIQERRVLHFAGDYIERYWEITKDHLTSRPFLQATTSLFVGSHLDATREIQDDWMNGMSTPIKRRRIRHKHQIAAITYRSFGQAIGVSEEDVNCFDDPELLAIECHESPPSR